MDIKTIKRIAIEAHRGQKRWNGDNYITHPIRISETMTDDITKAAALLHDVLEDTNINIQDLLDRGVSNEVVDIVKILTKAKNQRYVIYIDAIKQNKHATIVKIGDLKDNLSDVKSGSMKDKYELALYILERQDKKNK